MMNIMITDEPKIKVGLLQGCKKVSGAFNGSFRLQDNRLIDRQFSAIVEDGCIILSDIAGDELIRQKEIRCIALNNSTFTLFDVTIGVHFHWERKQEQTFQGNLALLLDENENIVAINEILLEDYLTSVISSEMSAEAPLEFLKAHAITSRSWLVATLNRSRKGESPDTTRQSDEYIRVYDREEHTHFDVCADDHCQRYQGIARLLSGQTQAAVQSTRGIFLIHNEEVCDARYHKACGGLTDNYENTWNNAHIPYLISVPDSVVPYNPIETEADAEQWILSRPDVYCNTTDKTVLLQILPSFDQETTDFFRWKMEYSRVELEEILREKSGIDFGHLHDLTPIERGPSGRISRLKIEGSKSALIVGKELEIRRWLSRSHLYSSAFVVSVEREPTGLPTRFILNGAGWGHGVGLCQIGAAVMATKGYSAPDILKHYFHGTELRKLY